MVLWTFEVFDDYVVALMLVLSWILFGVVPSELALAGFSKGSWFFVLGALGMGAAINKSGLLHRSALEVLHRIPPNYRLYTFILSAAGLCVTPLLPQVKGRIVIITPVAQAVSESIGFEDRSNGSAGLSLSAYVGASQLTFMFLTGSTVCLVGWSLLPESAKSEFGWLGWTVAALPAGIFMTLFLFMAICLLFPLEQENKAKMTSESVEVQRANLRPMTKAEWISLAVIPFAVMGWLTKPVHGVSEAWVAIAGLLAFLMTGVMDKNGLRNNIDWGILLFFGVIYSVGGICSSLGLDHWISRLVAPILSQSAFHPMPFLLAVLLLTYFVRFFLVKTPTVILLTLAVMSSARDLGIHPGVLLLTVLMAVESWFLPYQTPSYQITYCTTEGKAFSHAQARKLMVAKFIASILAVSISVPYWKLLGLIQ
jgi:anion transporter